jgi:hypothetical protein
MKYEKATANRGSFNYGGGGLTTFEAEMRLLKAGAVRCPCGEQATALIGGGGQRYRGACPACKQIARDRTRAAVMSIR